MKPEHHQQPTQQDTSADFPRPSSPQPETQSAMHSQQAECAAFDREGQRPTHGALSAIYNQVYR
jgi:hypothetical protein